MTTKEKGPGRWRWFIERHDYGRSWVILPTWEQINPECQVKELVLHQLVPIEVQYQDSRQLVSVVGQCVLTGNEPITAFFSAEEAQDLMDALWAAGMRPSRH